MSRSTLAVKLSKGDLIGGEYEVVKKLGEGGCGSVYRCRWVKTDREVAVKLLERTDEMARFVREAKMLRRIRHENVVRMLGSGYHEQRPFIVLEFMDGGSVRDLLDSKGKLPTELAAWVVIQAIRGLRASKTVHRDLKPENLLLTKGPRSRGISLVVDNTVDGAVLKVADFGLARQTEVGGTRLTNSGQVMGTPVYMSPEQCRNTKNVSVKSDIYSLGILFYEMVVGHPPFDGSNAYDIMRQQCDDEPKYPRLDAKVKAMLEKCLAKSPGKRYGSLYALERDLARLAGMGDPMPDGGWGRAIAILSIGFVLLGFIVWTLRDRLWPMVEPWVRRFGF